jgi:hypothetical protein
VDAPTHWTAWSETNPSTPETQGVDGFVVDHGVKLITKFVPHGVINCVEYIHWMTAQHRAQFDATVTFSNGGGLSAEGFRVDIASAEATNEQIAELFVASLNLLMVEQVNLSNVRIFPETHKGTHGGPSDS